MFITPKSFSIHMGEKHKKNLLSLENMTTIGGVTCCIAYGAMTSLENLDSIMTMKDYVTNPIILTSVVGTLSIYYKGLANGIRDASIVYASSLIGQFGGEMLKYYI